MKVRTTKSNVPPTPGEALQYLITKAERQYGDHRTVAETLAERLEREFRDLACLLHDGKLPSTTVEPQIMECLRGLSAAIRGMEATRIRITDLGLVLDTLPLQEQGTLTKDKPEHSEPVPKPLRKKGKNAGRESQMLVSFVNPKTGAIWWFPRDAGRYSALVGRSDVDHACVEGHFGCAGWEGGPCNNEHGVLFDDEEG